MRRIDRDRAVEVLLDAMALGTVAAAKKWNLSQRTIERYRARLTSDPELSLIVAERKKAEEQRWAEIRERFLRKAIAKLEELVGQAGLEQMRDVAGAVKIVGDLHVVAGALEDVEQSGPSRSGRAPSEIACGKGTETALRA